MRFFRSLDALAIHGESKPATYLMPTEAEEGELAAAARDSSLYLSRARRAHRDSPRPRYVVLSLVLLNDLPPLLVLFHYDMKHGGDLHLAIVYRLIKHMITQHHTKHEPLHI